VCRLDVDWDALRARLAAIAARAGVVAGTERGVLAIVEAVRGQDGSFIARELEWTLAAAELAGASRCQINAGLLEWLEHDVPGAELSVLSLNCRAAVEHALGRAGLSRRVSWVLGRGDVPAKPDPEGLELLLTRHGVTGDEALFVGDSPTDRACALAAGVTYCDVSAIGADWQRPGERAAAA
jgi:phosphoglycolate phosphatase